VDLSFAPDEQAFALEVRAWLAENVEIPPRFENIAEEVEFGRRWQSRLATNRWVGINLAGPTLLAHGTDDQKARWLPEILTAGEICASSSRSPTRAPTSRH